ncbi:restriction endonuclease [Haladaptatus cibarius]|uniref:restriction endonuclease n=1 Tax=Haladaptatus cibarius TaxID=453847 RepID=UPI0006787D76|nr:restriction endonuclease [Haladaptatus cibarius]
MARDYKIANPWKDDVDIGNWNGADFEGRRASIRVQNPTPSVVDQFRAVGDYYGLTVAEAGDRAIRMFLAHQVDNQAEVPDFRDEYSTNCLIPPLGWTDDYTRTQTEYSENHVEPECEKIDITVPKTVKEMVTEIVETPPFFGHSQSDFAIHSVYWFANQEKDFNPPLDLVRKYKSLSKNGDPPTVEPSLSTGEIQEQFFNIDPYEFEYLVADLYEHSGWKTDVTPRIADGGIDIIATRNEVEKNIEVKRHAINLSKKDIDEYDSIDVFVSAKDFTKECHQKYHSEDIELVNGDELAKQAKERDLDGLVLAYAGELEL